MIDDRRLIRYLMNLNAHRYLLLNIGNLFFQAAPERQNVAAVLHRHGNADSRFAVEEHLRFSRLHRTPLHFGNIAEAEHLAIGRYACFANRADIGKGSADAQINVVAFGFHHAGGRHFVLRLQRARDGLRIKPELGKLRPFDFDVDFFRLLADQLDLLHAWHVEQHPARLFRVLAHFLIAVAVTA